MSQPAPQTPAASGDNPQIQAALSKLSGSDRALAEAQRFCAVATTSRLGSMGPPVKLLLDGQAVFLCCEGCRDDAVANPQATLTKAKELREKTDRKAERK